MNFLTILILATIGALIGWITNLLAVKLLFRPFEAISIPFLKVKIQGLIPKRRREIAQSIGKTIENDLLTIEEIVSQLMKDHSTEEIFLVVKNKINKLIDQRLPGIIPSAFKGIIQNYFEDIIDKEGENFTSEIIQIIIDKGTSSIQLSKMIEDKINDFPLDKLEEIVLRIAKKELKHIEILGGILGFIIGLLQGIIIIFLQ